MGKDKEKEKDNGKIHHIKKTQIDLDVDIETNVHNIACLGKTMSLYSKQQLSNTWGSVH